MADRAGDAGDRGDAVSAAGTAEDERERALDALRESEEQFRVLADRSPTMIFINQGGRVVYANERCTEVMGYTREEFLSPGFDFLRLIAPESLDVTRRAFAEHAAGREVPSYEYALVAKDGRRVDALIGSRLIPYHGRPAILGIVTDITERKRMESELQRADKLESLGVLAGGLAHDFNNTLAIIAGNASLGRRLAPEGSELSVMLEEIERAALQGRQLTRQLLTFARGGAPVKRVLSPARLLREILGFVLSGSAVTGTLVLPDELWNVEVDEGQFVQVINNLVLNAQQAMPGGGRLEVAAANVVLDEGPGFALPPGRYVRIAVRDEGPGIPAAYRRRIFDPFFTTKAGGTGLGLSTVYSIVRRHGGHVDVESEVGRGSTFQVWLPASERAESAGPPQPEEAPATRLGSVLVMDDEEPVLQVVDRYLRLAGHRTVLARDGAAAVAAYREALAAGRRFDLVILDLTVPGGMGGREALERLRALDPQVCAAISSGYSEDPVMGDFRAHGLHGVLAKPYDLSELGRLVREALATCDGPGDG